MHCPVCGAPKTKVLATRHKKKPLQTLRYCECRVCRVKFSTLERAIHGKEITYVE